jgi:uncharacterized membrane protein
VLELDGVRRGPEHDAAAVEELPRRFGRGGAEDAERLVLVRHEGELGARDGGSRLQRELVERERPGDAARDGEHQPSFDCGQRRREGLDVGRPAERERARNRGDGLRARRDEERVVLELGAARGVRDVRLGVHGGEGVDFEERAALVGQLGEVDAVQPAPAERLDDGERPVPEPRLWRDDRHRHALLRQVPKGQRRLERSHSAACNQHSEASHGPHRGACRRGPHPKNDAIGVGTKFGALDAVALFLHLLGVVTLFAGMAVAAVGLEAARRRERASEIALLLGLTRVGVVLVGAGLVLAVACGFWLLDLTAFDLGDAWVEAALGLVLLGAVLGSLGGRRPKQARLLAERGGKVGDPELRRLLDDPLSRLLNGTAAAAYLAALALMVWKPG